MNNRIEQEILHGRKISNKAEFIWGWGTPAGKKRAERRANYFVVFGDIREGKKVLEIGCGMGIFTKKLAHTKAYIVAIDISPDLIQRATNEVKCDNVSFYIDDVENMRFEDSSFDCVVGSSVLHHLNLRRALLEINRVLKKNGKAIFTEPNMLNPQIILQKNIKPIGKILGDLPSETAFFRWQLTKIFLEAGFKKVSIKPFDFLHPWVPQFCIKGIEKIGLLLEKIPIIREIAGSLLIIAEK